MWKILYFLGANTQIYMNRSLSMRFAFEFGPYRAMAPARVLVSRLASLKRSVRLAPTVRNSLCLLFMAKDQLQRFTPTQKQNGFLIYLMLTKEGSKKLAQ